MKYFVGYLIKGKAEEWHIKTAKDIANKFNTWKIYEKLPPHITIFYLGGVEDVSDIRNFLKNWAKITPVLGNFYLNGFDRFDDKVVFAKIDADEEILQKVEDLRKEIKRISEITNEDFPVWHPHATLANKVTPQEINDIWNYVSKLEKPDFTLPFDNVAIFKFVGDQKWEVDELFQLGSS